MFYPIQASFLQFSDKHDVVVVFIQRVVEFFQDLLVGIGAIAFFQTLLYLFHQLHGFVHHEDIAVGEVGICLQSAHKVVFQLDEMRLLGLGVGKDMAFAPYIGDILVLQREVDAKDVITLAVVLHHEVGLQAISFVVVGIKRIRYGVSKLHFVRASIMPYFVVEAHKLWVLEGYMKVFGYIGTFGYLSLRTDGSSHHRTLVVMEIHVSQGKITICKHLDFWLVQIFAYFYFTLVLTLQVILQQMVAPTHWNQIYPSVLLVDGFAIKTFVFTGATAYATYIAEELALTVEQFEGTTVSLADTDVIVRNEWPPHLEDSGIIIFETDYLEVFHPFAQRDGEGVFHLVEVAGYNTIDFNGYTSVALRRRWLLASGKHTNCHKGKYMKSFHHIYRV